MIPHIRVIIHLPIGDLSLTPTPSPEPVLDAEVVISPTSTRLQVLQPFPSHFASHASVEALELRPMATLMRVRGKCTTDHISAAVRALLSYISLVFRQCLTPFSSCTVLNERASVMASRVSLIHTYASFRESLRSTGTLAEIQR